MISFRQIIKAISIALKSKFIVNNNLIDDDFTLSDGVEVGSSVDWSRRFSGKSMLR